MTSLGVGMSEREIIRAVADNFLYDDVRIPDEIREPWKTIWYRTDNSLSDCRTLAEAVRDACRELPNRRALERAILRAMPSETEYESLEQVGRSLAPIAWLWRGWIPRGMLTLLGASPGAARAWWRWTWRGGSSTGSPGRTGSLRERAGGPAPEKHRGLALQKHRGHAFMSTRRRCRRSRMSGRRRGG